MKPNVPDVKQVNLYQNGFISVKGSVLHGPGIVLPPQYGTVLWLKVAIPHTGKAVEGVCPGVVQTWEFPCRLTKKIKTIASINFLNIYRMTCKNIRSLQILANYLKEKSFIRVS